MEMPHEKIMMKEARKFKTDNDVDETNMNAIVGWIVNNGGKARHNGTDIAITTSEGERIAMCGDYIVRGLNDEFYPCKPDVFKQHAKM